MKLASALLLSAGAHLTALSVAGSLPGLPATGPSGGTGLTAPLHAVLAARRPEPEAARARRAQRRPESASVKVAERNAQLDAPLSRRYLSLGELDVRPQIKTHVMPQYPERLLSGTRGRVVLELLIAIDGSVDGVNVQRAEPGGIFEEAAVKAFSKARFSPGMKRGVPVPSLVRIEVTFGD